MRQDSLLRSTLVTLSAGWLAIAMASSAMGCRSKQPRVVPDAIAPPVVVPASARTSLALTIYSRGEGGDAGYAFVREERKTRLPAGRFVLTAPDIASGLVPETTRFELVSLDDDDHPQSAAELYEQRYRYDQLGPERLLEKAEGQRITAVWRAGGRRGKERSLTGTLVSSKQGVLLRLDSGEVTPIDSDARFYFAALPPDLVVEPTLSWNVGSYEPSDAVLRLSYRAEKFAWSADYVVHLGEDQKRADVEGWVTVVNQGDTSFENARLQLMAGTVNTVDVPEEPMIQRQVLLEANMDGAFRGRVRAQQESLGDLHLYTIEHPTTLPARSSKQVRFAIARDVPMRLEASTTVQLGGGDFEASLVAELDHDDKSALAVPLPAGRARTSMRSGSGVTVQVGEGKVEHTPVGERWRVPVAADANQITKVIERDVKLLGRDRSGAAMSRRKLAISIRNAATIPRHRRVILDPGALRFLALPVAGGARMEGPKRIVLEADLAPNETRAYELVIDVVDPGDVEQPDGFFSLGAGGTRR